MPFYILFFFCILPVSLTAQDLSYSNYTIEDGLPSNEIYALHKDSDGYIWIGTDRGICKFNGYEFETFTTLDGVPDNTVFNFYEDYKGRLWFYTFNGEIGFYFEDKFYRIDIPQKTINLIDGIFVSKNDDVTITFNGMLLLNFKLNGNQLIVNSVRRKGCFRRMESGKLMFNQAQVKKNILDTTALIRNDLSFRNNTKSYSVKIGSNRFCEIVRGFEYCVVVDSNRSVIHKLELAEDNERFTGIGGFEKYWYLTTSENRLLKYNYNHFNEPLESVDLGIYVPSNVLVDDFGGMWISTLNKGVLYVPNKDLKVSRVRPEVVGNGLVQFGKNEFVEFLANKNQELYRFSMKDDILFPIIESKNRFESIHSYDTSFLVFSRRNTFLFDTYGNQIEGFANKEINKLPYQGVTALKITDQGDVIGSGTGKVIVNNNIIRCDELRRPVALEIEGDTIWVGDFNGLFAFSISKMKALDYKKSQLLNNRVSDLKKLKDLLIIGTRGEGVILKRKDDIIQITKATGISDNSITSIETDGKNTFWIAGNNGITKITVNSFNPFNYKVWNLGREDGILLREIRDIQFFQDTLCILTENLIYRLQKDYQAKRVRPKLYMKSLLVNDKAVDLTKEIELSYAQNNLEFKFDGLYFRDNLGLIYQYSLDDGKTWNETQNRFVIFKDLPSGTYSFKLRAVTLKGEESETRYVTFTIAPPFWQTWLFYLSILFLAGLIIFGSAKLYVKQIKLRTTILESELKALRSMMNPHFTFNSINSIQHFIVQKDTKGALEFTSKFAGLIRMILANSSNEFITIQKELDALRLYLEIEQIRLEAKFTFQIIVDPNISTDYDKIPSMILQPYIENALWHGIMNKDGEGNIKVGIQKTTTGIFCYIEDDGVGRAKVNSYKNSLNANHKSLGMSMTKERLNLIKKSSGRIMEVNIVDLYDQYGNGIGTRVEINIENPK